MEFIMLSISKTNPSNLKQAPLTEAQIRQKFHTFNLSTMNQPAMTALLSEGASAIETFAPKVIECLGKLGLVNKSNALLPLAAKVLKQMQEENNVEAEASSGGGAAKSNEGEVPTEKPKSNLTPQQKLAISKILAFSESDKALVPEVSRILHTIEGAPRSLLIHVCSSAKNGKAYGTTKRDIVKYLEEHGLSKQTLDFLGTHFNIVNALTTLEQTSNVVELKKNSYKEKRVTIIFENGFKFGPHLIK
jgi:hypothetical protein